MGSCHNANVDPPRSFLFSLGIPGPDKSFVCVNFPQKGEKGKKKEQICRISRPKNKKFLKKKKP